MRITFLRHGHSNNSSSSHSLIFTRGAMPYSNESTEFGWNSFTCSDKNDKLNYLLICLYGNFKRLMDFPHLYKITDYNNKEWSGILDEVREKLGEIEFGLFKDWARIYLGQTVFDISGYVDHQSAIFFPLDRSGEKIHHEFAKDFIREFVNNNWYVFGGNDNDEYQLSPPTEDEKSDCEQFRIVWSFLTDTRDIICVKDSLTGEYVLSNIGGTRYNGSILKVKF